MAVSVRHLLFLFAALALMRPVAAQELFPVQSAPAMRAFDFVAKFGVNGNLDSGGTVENEIADMNYIGVKNIRTSVYGASASDAQSWASWVAGLSAAGIRQHLDVQASGTTPFGSMADWLAAVKQYIVAPYGAAMVTGVSGPNETDSGQFFGYAGQTGVPAANQAQKDLYAGIKADPALAGIPVDMWPLAQPYNASIQAQIGDMTAWCDRANLHDYYAADDNAAVVRAAGPIYQQMQDYLAADRNVCNRHRFITTETGWYTPWAAGDNNIGTNDYVQARLVLADLFDHATLPYCEGVYIFTLRWGAENGSDPGYGLMNDDGTPKASGTAVRNLMALITDAGVDAATFAPKHFAYSASGMPPASGNFVIAKSNGAFDILLWNETPIWNVATGTIISNPTNSVTVTLPPGSSGNVYDPINGGAAPLSSFANVGQVRVGLNDAPLIIEVSP